MHACVLVYVQAIMEVWMYVHVCVHEDLKTTLALLPQVPSSLVFETGSPAGLELANEAGLVVQKAPGVHPSPLPRAGMVNGFWGSSSGAMLARPTL